MTDDGGLRFEMDRLMSYDDDSLINEMRRVAALLPEGAISRDLFETVALVHTSTLIRRFGGWKGALERAGLSDRYGGKRISAKMRDQRARDLSAEDMVDELRRVAALVGGSTITRVDLLKHSDLVGERAVINRFGSWKCAVEAAGLTLSALGRRWSDDDYFDNLLEVWTHHGKRPTFQQMNHVPSRITGNGYAKKFGTWLRAVAAFVERVNSDIELVEREAAAPAISTTVPAKPRQEDQRNIPIGLRYQVLRRDRFRCVTCGRSPATDLDCVLHIDHLLPFSRGGKTRVDNLRSLCAECNVGKGTKD